MHTWSLFTYVALGLTIVVCEDVQFDDNFNMEWSVVSGRMLQPKCVAIPANMSLCHKIGYDTMRLPNLLEHDNLEEATSQAQNWNALIGIRCHPDTQVFLCSLFSPVCLERVVYPCKSLCEGVKRGCEGYMRNYGFPWPEMFRCDKFPNDNGLCIQGPSNSSQSIDDRVCRPCQEPDTYEGILHNYCKADFVVKSIVKGLDKKSLTAEPGEIEVLMGKRKKKFYKKNESLKKVTKLLNERDTKIYIKQGIGCSCDRRVVPGENHLMGLRYEEKFDRTGQKVVRFYTDFITSWSEGKKNQDEEITKVEIKKALRAIRKNENICEGGLPTLNTHREIDEEPDGSQKTKRHRQKDLI